MEALAGLQLRDGDSAPIGFGDRQTVVEAELREAVREARPGGKATKRLRTKR